MSANPTLTLMSRYVQLKPGGRSVPRHDLLVASCPCVPAQARFLAGLRNGPLDMLPACCESPGTAESYLDADRANQGERRR